MDSPGREVCPEPSPQKARDRGNAPHLPAETSRSDRVEPSCRPSASHPHGSARRMMVVLTRKASRGEQPARRAPVADRRCPPATPALSVQHRRVQRGEGERFEVRAGWGVASQIHGQPVAERRHPRAEAGVRAVPTEQLSDLPPNCEERADGARGALRWVGRGKAVHQPRKVVRAARPRQRRLGSSSE